MNATETKSEAEATVFDGRTYRRPTPRPGDIKRRRCRPGDRVGRWTVLDFLGYPASNPTSACYLCRCECGVGTGNSTQCRACGHRSSAAKQRRKEPRVCRWCGKTDSDVVWRRGLAAECPACHRAACRNGRCTACRRPTRKPRNGGAALPCPCGVTA